VTEKTRFPEKKMSRKFSQKKNLENFFFLECAETYGKELSSKSEQIIFFIHTFHMILRKIIFVEKKLWERKIIFC